MSNIKHQAWPDIGQFRNLIRAVKEKATFSHLDANGDAVFDNCKPLPTLKFQGTVKLHGTNAAIGVNTQTNEYWAQSRERILTAEEDNAGFYIFANEKKPYILAIVEETKKHKLFKENDLVLIFGEYAGKSIQKNVAISEFPKSFYIFSICLINEDGRIYLNLDDVLGKD